MLNHIADDEPWPDYTHKSAQDGARTSGHPIWNQELLPLDLSRVLMLILLWVQIGFNRDAIRKSFLASTYDKLRDSRKLPSFTYNKLR